MARARFIVGSSQVDRSHAKAICGYPTSLIHPHSGTQEAHLRDHKTITIPTVQ